METLVLLMVLLLAAGMGYAIVSRIDRFFASGGFVEEGCAEGDFHVEYGEQEECAREEEPPCRTVRPIPDRQRPAG